MTLFLTVVGCMLLTISVFMLLGVTPERMVGDLMDLLRPSGKLHTRAEKIQNKKRRTGLYSKLRELQTSMEATGRGRYFPLLFAATGLLTFAALVLAAWLQNWFLAPTFCVAFGMLPMLYATGVVRDYEKAMRAEMETALSVITNAYLRMEDVTAAIGETISYIKPPLRSLFEHYLADMAVNPAREEALYRLRERLDDQIWFEWVTTLIQCQDDRALRDNLQPIVAKLTDVRIVNDQVSGAIASARSEFYIIVAFLFANYPMMYAMNPDGYEILVGTTAGKAITGFVAAVVLACYFIMRRMTKAVTFEQ